MGVDVQPGNSANEITVHANGQVQVAILGAADFSVGDVDVSSVVFAGANVKMKSNGSPFASISDVSGDGWADLVMHFDIESLQLVPGDYDVDVTGTLLNGDAFRGHDHVHVVGQSPRPYDRRKLHPREAFVVQDPASATLRVESVWPNPAASGAQLVFSLASDEQASVEMWSASGRLVSRRDLGALGAGPHVVDLSEARALPNGVYFVRLSQGWASARTKLIVQH